MPRLTYGSRLAAETQVVQQRPPEADETCPLVSDSTSLSPSSTTACSRFKASSLVSVVSTYALGPRVWCVPGDQRVFFVIDANPARPIEPVGLPTTERPGSARPADQGAPSSLPGRHLADPITETAQRCQEHEESDASNDDARGYVQHQHPVAVTAGAAKSAPGRA